MVAVVFIFFRGGRSQELLWCINFRGRGKFKQQSSSSSSSEGPRAAAGLEQCVEILRSRDERLDQKSSYLDLADWRALTTGLETSN